jgi:hypothetical protein
MGQADPQALATFIGGRYQAGEPDDPLRGVVTVPIEVGHEPAPIPEEMTSAWRDHLV